MRVAEITTRIVRAIEVPRSQLADFFKLPEAQPVGVYFLMGELPEAGLPRAYIGQSGNVGTGWCSTTRTKTLEPGIGGHLVDQQHDANARPVSAMVRHCTSHQGGSLQPGEQQHRITALGSNGEVFRGASGFENKTR